MSAYEFRCPRKVILFGEHSVVHGKLAIAVAFGMNMEVILEIDPSKPDSLELISTSTALWTSELQQFGERTQEMALSDPRKPACPSNELVAFLREFTDNDKSNLSNTMTTRIVLLYLWSQIIYPSRTRGAIKISLKYDVIWPGLGNSAAYSVLVSAALLTAAGLISSSLTEDDKDLINGWAYGAECINHGSPSGVDNTVCCYGGMLRFAKGKLPVKEFRSPGIRLCVVFSNQVRSTKVLAERVGGLKRHHVKVFDAIFEAMHTVALEGSDFIDGVLKDPSDLVNFRRLEELVDINQALLKSLTVSTKNLDKICSIAEAHGFHAKLTGAGGGGCAFVIIPPDANEIVVENFKAELECFGFPFREADVGVRGLTVQRLSGKLEVVVTGVGVITPLGKGVPIFWKKLIGGTSGTVSWIDESDSIPCRVAARVPRDDLPKPDRGKTLATQFGLCAAEEAIIVARLNDQRVDKRNVGVSFGTGMSDLSVIEACFDAFKVKKYRGVSPHFVPLILPNMIAGHVSMEFGFRGPNHCVCTACAAGAHSLGDAFRFVKYGDADVMVSGSAEAPISKIAMAGFSRVRALSTKYNQEPSKASRPFDEGRDGFVMGEGAGVMVLEELNHAKNRGAEILGEILGYGMSADANHLTAPREDGEGVMACMRKAVSEAKLPLEAIGYINAHATSTPLGDVAELSAIKALFGGPHSQSLAVSSIKGAIGHLLGAAGMVEAIAALLACQTGVLPPTINLTSPCDGELNLVPNEAQKWDSVFEDDAGRKRRIALTNSFGFGGTNASIVLSSFVE
ncbi:unnamed protein product [Notodromas monacha]|uniref:beta-ketoacyl-[acyl-carrier-protein] synthase I n=1 Tax=Notodromas monacha TaxID=399045 RepID=A0A7R9BQ91_9CRUS|nr:unnamed protein product [Notodromas monacha]CAG0918163.1 unnamed protein product [Notodromas monacha]